MPRDPTKSKSKSKTSKKTKKTKSKPKPKPKMYPSYKEMITRAILDANKRNGVSRQAIVKYIQANYPVEEKNLKIHLKLALKRLVAEKDGEPAPLLQIKSSFKLSPSYRIGARKEVKEKGQKGKSKRKGEKEKG